MQSVPVFGLPPLGVENQSPHSELVQTIKKPGGKNAHGRPLGQLPPIPRGTAVRQMRHVFEQWGHSPNEPGQQQRKAGAVRLSGPTFLRVGRGILRLLRRLHAGLGLFQLALQLLDRLVRVRAREGDW